MSLARTLAGSLLQSGGRLVSRATQAVLEDPRGQEAVARAVGLAQHGRRRFEQMQQRLLAAAGIPGRQDYQELARQLARIKRKARELSVLLETAHREGGEREDETR